MLSLSSASIFIGSYKTSFSPFGVLLESRNTYRTHRKLRRMVSLLEIFLSAILGDLATRSIDFLASRRAKPQAPQDVEDRLQRVLLRAQIIVDEAMGRRRITSSSNGQSIVNHRRPVAFSVFSKVDSVKRSLHSQCSNR
jgi:hypothetical protein